MSSTPRTVAIGEPVRIGRTVGEFIDGLRKLGMHDAMPIASIEIGIAMHGTGVMVAEINDQNEAEVREL